MRKIIPALIAFFALLSSLAANSGSISYSIGLTSASYNATTNTTAFTYSVTSNPSGGPAISHWVLGVTGACAGSSALVSSSDPLTGWTQSDPTTGLAGIKFDRGYNDLETRTVVLVLAGNWATGAVNIAVKSGNDFVNGTVQGPICGAATAPATYTVSGTVFFDSNYNGALNADEKGLGGFGVALVTQAGATVATTTTAADGSYSFSGVVAGAYYVAVSHRVSGLSPTTLTEHDVTVVAANVVAPVTGYAINFQQLSGMTANGFTIGFWKNNLEKALAGTTKGVQINATTLASYTTTVSTLVPLAPFENLTGASAVATLSATGSAPTVLLAKQLLAAEYNVANGAFLNGDRTLTQLFVYQGEYVLKNAASYSSDYLLALKNWFDAYNNTHGGPLVAPAP